MPRYNLRLWDGQRTLFGSSDADVIDYRAGGDPSTTHKSPGRSKYDPVTLERGVTQDSAFANWAAKVAASGGSLGSEVSLANLRKNLYLEFYNEAGQLVIGYKIYRGWVSEYQALPPAGLRLHNLHLRDGKTVEEKLAVIFEESLSRLS